MPRVKAIEIYFKRNGKKRTLHPLQEIRVAGSMVLIVHPEIQVVPTKVGRFKKKVVNQQREAWIEVDAIPVEDIERIDFGHTTPEVYNKMRADMAKKMEEAEKKAECKPGETYPGEFDKKEKDDKETKEEA